MSEREKLTTELRRIIIVKTDEQNENESADSCSAMRDEAGEQEVTEDKKMEMRRTECLCKSQTF